MCCVVDHAWVACVASTVLCSCLVLRRKLTLRASRRSVALSRSIHRCSAHARRVCACSRGRRKRLGSGLVDGHVRVASSTMLGLQVASMLPLMATGTLSKPLSKPSTLGTTPLTAMFQVLLKCYSPRRWKCWRCSRWKCWRCSRQRNATPPCEWQRRCSCPPPPPKNKRGESFLKLRGWWPPNFGVGFSPCRGQGVHPLSFVRTFESSDANRMHAL